MSLKTTEAFDLFQNSSQVIPNTERVILNKIMNTAAKENAWVFVYGTLRRGGSNAWRMKEATFVDAATALGRLYRVDWYPGAIFDQTAGTVIHGELYAVPMEPLRELDAFEGDEYERINITVITSTQKTYEAWAWQYRPSIEHLTKIHSGDWLSL